MIALQKTLYLEYEDSSFWAIRVEGSDCFTAQGSKYHDFLTGLMLKAGFEEEKHCRMPPNAKRGNSWFVDDPKSASSFLTQGWRHPGESKCHLRK